jgi:DNA-binding PadR family transcriptional regulator
MEDRLRNLKRSMKQTVFSGLTFTEVHKNKVKNKLSTLNLKSEADVVLAILQLLTQEKTGFELNQSIRARGIQNFENNEGKLYMFLHMLEQKGYLKTFWNEEGGKLYQVNNKGTKLLNQVDNQVKNTRSILKGILEG